MIAIILPHIFTAIFYRVGFSQNSTAYFLRDFISYFIALVLLLRFYRGWIELFEL